MRLKSKIALITGGGRGIGKSTAEVFVKEGATVVIWDLLDEGERVAESLRHNGGNAVFMKVAVNDIGQVKSGMSKILDQYGRLDILINNAGITRDRTLLKMSEEEWDQVIDVNLKGVFNCTQAAAHYMKDQGYGRIVSASSNVGLRGNYGQTNYVASKAGVIGMTKVWAMELGKFGITVNCIAPGFIKTEMTDAIPEEVKKQSIGMIPVRRLGEPEDIAHGYLYLASDEASFVNGVCICIDGGVAR